MREGLHVMRWVALLAWGGLLAGCVHRQDESTHAPVVMETDDYYQAAAQRGKLILQRMEQQLGPDDTRLITPLLNLSMVYFRQGRHDDSDRLLERAWTLIGKDPDIDMETLHIPLRYGTLPDAVRQGDTLDWRGHLAMGTNVNQRDAHGRTALHHAARHGNTSLVEQLMRKGAVVTVRDWQQKTPRQLAEEAGHAEIVELLGQRLATRPDAAEPDGDTPVADDLFDAPFPAAAPEDDFYSPPATVDDDFFSF